MRCAGKPEFGSRPGAGLSLSGAPLDESNGPGGKVQVPCRLLLVRGCDGKEQNVKPGWCGASFGEETAQVFGP